MFKQVRFSNFKGFKGDHQANLAPITLIYGQNSAGKSAVMESLLLLSQSIRKPVTDDDELIEPLIFSGKFIDLGNFPATINDHNLSKSISLGISYEEEDQSESGFTQFDSTIKWDHTHQKPLLVESIYSLSNLPENTVIFRGSNSKSNHSLKPVNDDGFKTVASIVNETVTTRFTSNSKSPVAVGDDLEEANYQNWSFLPGMQTPDRDSIDELRNSNVANEEELRKIEIAKYWRQSEWRHMLLTRYMDTRSQLLKIRYIGPLRKSPTRVERLQELSEDYVGSNGSKSASLLYKNPRAVNIVNEYLNKLEIPYTVSIKRIDQDSSGSLGEIIGIQLIDKRSNVVLSMEDVGFGISQILPILVQIATKSDTLIMIEQPELHIHPAVQARLGDVLIDAISDGSQFVIETHSEHLILRLQRRIRQRVIDSKDIKVLYVDSNDTGSHILELGIGEDGNFRDEWPHGFFAERLEEILAD